jgi:protein involved in polysaccharide export with SLBB domain
MEASLGIGAVVGLSALLTNADPMVAVWTTAITVAGGLLLQIIRDRREERRYQRDRREILEHRKLSDANNTVLRAGVERIEQSNSKRNEEEDLNL